MAINYATLAKNVNGVIEYIYPKTVACLVEYTPTQTVEEKLNELDQLLKNINLTEVLKSYYTKNEIDNLIYHPISLLDVRVSPDVLEVGCTQAVTVYWQCDKIPAGMNIDGVRIIPPTQAGQQVFTNITNDRTFTVTVTDQGTDDIPPWSDSKSAMVKFLNGIYYGVARVPAEYNSSFILTLPNKLLQNTPECSFTLSPGQAQYIFYACPSNYTPKFNVGGFIGGFEVVATMNFTNCYGNTMAYTIYRSNNDNLGPTVVNVLA